MPDNTKTPQPAADPIQEPAAPASPTAADLVVDLWFVDNFYLSLIHISEPTRPRFGSRMPSSA